MFSTAIETWGLYPSKFAAWPYFVVLAIKGTRWKPNKRALFPNILCAVKKKPVLQTIEPTTAFPIYGFIHSNVLSIAKPGRHRKMMLQSCIASCGLLLMTFKFPLYVLPSWSVTIICWDQRSGCRVKIFTSTSDCNGSTPAHTCAREPPPQIHTLIINFSLFGKPFNDALVLVRIWWLLYVCLWSEGWWRDAEHRCGYVVPPWWRWGRWCWCLRRYLMTLSFLPTLLLWTVGTVGFCR